MSRQDSSPDRPPPGAGLGVAPGAGSLDDPGELRALGTQRWLLTMMIPIHGLWGWGWTVLASQAGSNLTWSDFGDIARIVITTGLAISAATGLVLALYNLRALRKPHPKMRASLLRYWWFSMALSLCLPLGIFGLINLARSDVRRALEGG